MHGHFRFLSPTILSTLCVQLPQASVIDVVLQSIVAHALTMSNVSASRTLGYARGIDLTVKTSSLQALVNWRKLKSIPIIRF